MQRYMAGDLPKGGAQPGGERVPLPEAVQLGRFIRQERGREGAAAFVAAVSPLLPGNMSAQLAAQLGVPLPAQGAGTQPADSGGNAQKTRAGGSSAQEPQRAQTAKPPDMEAVLRLMQMMKGGGGKDLSALMQLLKT